MHALLSLVALALSPVVAGDDPQWGGFRGNNGCGVSATSEGLPDALDLYETAQWRTELPGGYSSPIVAGAHVFVTGTEGKKLVTLCLDRETGEIAWSREVEFSGERTGMNSPAAPTPVTDGKRVFVVFHDIGLIAYDLEGEELWRHEIGPFNIPHGMSTSPLVHDGLVVLLADQDTDAYLVAYDAATGAQKWKVERPAATHSYSTPAIYAPDEGPAQVVVSGSFQISGYSLADGERLWWVNGAAYMSKAVPVIVGELCIVNAYQVSASEFGMAKMTVSFDEALAEFDEDEDGKLAQSEWGNDFTHMAWFILDLDGDDLLSEEDWDFGRKMATETGALMGIRLDGKGDVTESHVAWRYDDRRGLPDCPSPLVFGNTLYMIKEGGLLTAMDPATGDILKQGRVGEPDQYFASPVAADGKLFTASQSGQLAVVEAGAEWKVLSVNSLDEDVWSTPAIADGQVFVRSQAALYCFQDLSSD